MKMHIIVEHKEAIVSNQNINNCFEIGNLMSANTKVTYLGM